MVVAIDDRHIDVVASQRSRREQTAEAATDDHDAMPATCSAIADRICWGFDVAYLGAQKASSLAGLEERGLRQEPS